MVSLSYDHERSCGGEDDTSGASILGIHQASPRGGLLAKLRSSQDIRPESGHDFGALILSVLPYKPAVGTKRTGMGLTQRHA